MRLLASGPISSPDAAKGMVTIVVMEFEDIFSSVQREVDGTKIEVVKYDWFQQFYGHCTKPF